MAFVQDFTKNQQNYDLSRAIAGQALQPIQGASPATALGKILTAYLASKGMRGAQNASELAAQEKKDTRKLDMARAISALKEDTPYQPGPDETFDETDQLPAGLMNRGTGNNQQAMIEAMIGAQTPDIQNAGLKAMLAQTEAIEDKPNYIGKYNPGDWKADSWARALKSGAEKGSPHGIDPTKLERYEPAWVGKVGGVTTAVNRADPTQPSITLGDRDTELKWETDLVTAKAEATAAAQKKVQQAVQGAKLGAVQRIYDTLSTADLGLIYGKGEKWYPDFFRSQKGIDLMADRDQLIAMLAMGARGELKGQGTITDNETAMLEKAVTTLQNVNISPEKAKGALDEAMGVLFRSAGEEPLNTGDKPISEMSDAELIEYRQRLSSGNN